MSSLNARKRAMRMKPHQQAAFNDVKTELRKSDRATLVMACGTGKTLVGELVAADVVSKKQGLVVALFPSLALIDQTHKAWIQNWPQPEGFQYMIVCGDSTIGRGEDEIEIDAASLPYAVTTSQDEVEAFVGKRRKSRTQVIFVTYQSAHLVGAALLALGRQADFGLFDEAHRTAGLLDSTFGYALHDDQVPMHKRLFMTATPRIVKRYRRNKDGEAPVVSMDNEIIYGRRAHTYTFRQAVKDGVICDYEIIVSHVSRSELPGGGGVEEEDENTAAMIAMSKAIEKYGTRKIISFHLSIPAAKRFAAEANAMLADTTAVHVNGHQKTDERGFQMRLFEQAERGLATNARCLTEGVDVPAVDMVAFMSRRDSKVDIVQAVGRALRKSPGKTKGYILVPLLLDTEEGETIEAAVARKKLDTLWAIVSSMMDEDNDLAFDFEARKRDVLGGEAVDGQPGPEGGSAQPVPIPRGPIVVLSETYNVEDLVRAIDTDLVHNLSDGFDHGVARMNVYCNKTGKANPPRRYVDETGFNLGSWCLDRRQNYKEGILLPCRIAKLEGLPGWSWSVFDDRFANGFARLRVYCDKTGKANPPNPYVDEIGFNLSAWCRRQRNHYKEGKLSPDRIAKLESVPGWSWGVLDDRFAHGFARLRVYCDKTSKANLPYKYVDETGFNLGTWCQHQRQVYKTGKLSPDRIAKLEGIPGWSWNPFDDGFDHGFARLRVYCDKTGKANPPNTYVDKTGFKLGSWCASRRKDRKNCKLSPDRIAKLESLPGWSWILPAGSPGWRK